MKGLIRNTTVNSLSLYFLALGLDGVKIEGGAFIYILGGLILSIMLVTIKPILNLISLPLNLITLGLFSFFINAIILYLLTVFLPNISITSFTFNGFSFAGFIVPKIYFNTLMAFVASASILSIIHSYFDWLLKD